MEILKALEPEYIQGLTLLGGEPMELENQQILAGLLRDVRQEFPQKDIWCYTGFTYEEDLCQGGRRHGDCTDELLRMVDVLVDGKFIQEKKNLTLSFRGSENQRVIDMPKTLLEGRVVLSSWNGYGAFCQRFPYKFRENTDIYSVFVDCGTLSFRVGIL